MFAFNFNNFNGFVMTVFDNQSNLKAYLNSYNKQLLSIGFVPTMGALHFGHLSLISESLKNNSITVVSIFVNPTQFNNAEDLKKYPRNLEKDIVKIKELKENVIVYAPTIEDIYPNKLFSEKFNFDGLENKMEGKQRPGHFDGVGTIVKKLLEIINPTNAYFGEKDFQQLLIVKNLVKKHKLPVNIIGCKIYREENMLAMSSRNERLSKKERDKASFIYQILSKVKDLFDTKSANEITKWVKNKFMQQSDFDLDYFEIADESTLNTCKRKSKSKKYRAFIAVNVNKIRLIDNISLN